MIASFANVQRKAPYISVFKQKCKVLFLKGTNKWHINKLSCRKLQSEYYSPDKLNINELNFIRVSGFRL